MLAHPTRHSEFIGGHGYCVDYGGVGGMCKGLFINYMDMAGGGHFVKCPYYYRSL